MKNHTENTLTYRVSFWFASNHLAPVLQDSVSLLKPSSKSNEKEKDEEKEKEKPSKGGGILSGGLVPAGFKPLE